MKRPITFTLLSLIALSTGAVVQANDIEDFFKAAIRGSSRSHDHDHHNHRTSYRGRGYDAHDHRDHGDTRLRRTSSFNISIGVNRPRVAVAPVPVYPIIEAPRPMRLPAPFPGSHNHGPAFPAPPVPVRPIPVNPVRPRYLPSAANRHAEFGYGDIVDCPVPLFSRVKVRDRDNIHPRAVDIVIAVKDPNTCRHACTCCEKRSVFVPLCVPPCPLEKVKVSRDGTRMELDYGDYEVDITSRGGLITVDYDD